VAAKAFFTNIGATGANAASAAPRFISVLRLNSLAATPVDSEEFLFLVINLPPGLVSRVVGRSLLLIRLKINQNFNKSINFMVALINNYTIEYAK
jgi:hypothetical protein